MSQTLITYQLHWTQKDLPVAALGSEEEEEEEDTEEEGEDEEDEEEEAEEGGKDCEEEELDWDGEIVWASDTVC